MDRGRGGGMVIELFAFTGCGGATTGGRYHLAGGRREREKFTRSRSDFGPFASLSYVYTVDVEFPSACAIARLTNVWEGLPLRPAQS